MAAFYARLALTTCLSVQRSMRSHSVSIVRHATNVVRIMYNNDVGAEQKIWDMIERICCYLGACAKNCRIVFLFASQCKNFAFYKFVLY